MNCPKCGKKILQAWGRWSPNDPDVTRRGYICYTCKIGYTEIYSKIEKRVIDVEEVDLREKREIQTTLGDF